MMIAIPSMTLGQIESTVRKKIGKRKVGQMSISATLLTTDFQVIHDVAYQTTAHSLLDIVN